MQAVILNDTLTYCRDIAPPTCSVDESLIALRLAGICATDLELINGYAGFTGIPGHEFVGVVEAVGNPADRHWLGRRVVGSINIGCRQCETCLQQGAAHCPQRKVLGIRDKNGVFADYFTLPTRNLYAVPDSVADDAAVFTEPLAAAIRITEQLRNIPITNVTVIGPGRLGMLIAKTLSLAGYTVRVAGRSRESLWLADQWSLPTVLVHDIADRSCECAVDATGNASGFRQALRIAKPRGTIILKSTFSTTESLDLSPVVVNEINLIGSRCGPFADALALLTSHALPITMLIDGRYPLQNATTAFRHAAQSGVRKILLQP